MIFAVGSPGFDPTAGRLLQNRAGIGDAIKPFYGPASGNRLTLLLHDAANTRWHANGTDIADFLAAVNPRSWPADVMRADMREHLDRTLAEAAHELHGQYAASVTDYEAIHAHILMMADQLSSGVIAQFPSRFR